ncbi:hypothetical protein GN956_G7521 [Arapaima gigas]
MSTDHFLLSLTKDINNVDYDRWKRRVLHHHVAREYVPRATRAPMLVGVRPMRSKGGRDKRRTVESLSSTSHKESDHVSGIGKLRGKQNVGGLDDVSVEKKTNIEKLKLLVKYRRDTLSKLQGYCASLLELNLQTVGEIVDMDKKSFCCAQDLVTKHHRLEKYIASFKDWSLSQIRQTKNELKDAETAAKKSCSLLQEQLATVEAELAKAHARRDMLRTYREQESPIQGLKTTAIRMEIDRLREAQQHELEDVSRICQTVIADLKKRYKEQEEKIRSATAKKKLLCAPPSLLLMISHNCTMKREIDLHKKVIKELEETCEELVKNVKELQRSQATARQAFFRLPAPHLIP